MLILVAILYFGSHLGNGQLGHWPLSNGFVIISPVQQKKIRPKMLAPRRAALI